MDKKMEKKSFTQRLLGVGLPLILFLSLFGVIFYILVDNNEDIVRLVSVEILVLLMAMFWLAGMFWSGKIKFVRNILNLPILLFVGTGLISLVGATNPFQGLAELSRLGIYALLYFLIINNISEEKTVNVFVYTLLIITTVISIHGIFQYLKLDFFWFMFPPGASVDRVSSVFGNADFLGGYLAMVFPISFSLFLFRKRKILFGLSSVLIFVCLLLTFTRSAWVSFGLSLIFLLILLFIYKSDILLKSRKYLIGMVIVFILFAVILNFTTRQGIFHRLSAILNWSEYSVQVRFGLWRTALDIFKKNPLIGVGLDNFKIVAQGCRVHNEYLQILAETGILGLGVFAWFIFTYFRTGLRAVKNSTPYQQILLISFISSVFAMLIDSLFCFPLHRVSHNVLFWSVIGMTMIMKKGDGPRLHPHLSPLPLQGEEKLNSATTKSSEATTTKSKFAAIGIVASVVVAIFFILRSFMGVFYYQRGFELNRYADQGQDVREKTKQTFEKAAKLSPFHYQIQHDWAIVAIQSGDLEKGIKAMQWSERLYPGRLPDVRLNLGLLYYEKGDYKKAEEVWFKTIEKFPSCAQAYFYLGGLYANRNKQEDAEKYLAKAVELEPENIEFLRALAKIYFRKGERVGARKAIEKALSINPQDEELKKLAQMLGILR